MIHADTPKAACLTPPAVGGVAVIQVVGRTAPAIVAPLLRSRHPLDLEDMDPGEIRLCRWVDSDQTIDDALVAVRPRSNGEFIIDISLHGGPRIVQRSLLMLKHAGAAIVEPRELLGVTWEASDPIETELLPLFLQARTRAVAAWLGEVVQRLPQAVRKVLDHLQSHEFELARAALESLCAAEQKARFLLNGVRVVLIGGPNVGKSTLANALAGRDQAIVSEMPGTTRDWVDHPGAISGVPCTFVDTAGLRDTLDPIEQEAMRRTHVQAATADLVLWVIDRSAPAPAPRDLTADWGADSAPMEPGRRPPPPLVVLNKCDLPPHPGFPDVLAWGQKTAMVSVSARTGNGLDQLRAGLLDTLRLTGWRRNALAPLTPRQQDCCQTALSALGSEPRRPEHAIAALRSLLGQAPTC
jgi:tRNA modification GTPase